ncbi:MAG: hypothetical protein Q4C96_07965 [Planctomycetia bacterium]|nr:hypothetical protein [Planctomycetia bacterium]
MKARRRNSQEIVGLKEFEEKLLSLGADLETARKLLKTDEEIYKARDFPASKRPWLPPAVKKTENSKEETASEAAKTPVVWGGVFRSSICGRPERTLVQSFMLKQEKQDMRYNQIIIICNIILSILLVTLIVQNLPMSDLSGARYRNPIYEKWNWDCELFFKDSDVLELIRAIEYDDLDTIKACVKKGVDVNAKGLMNVTPLVWALLADHKTFRCLLELGADPNVPVEITHTEARGSDRLRAPVGMNGSVLRMICEKHICFHALMAKVSGVSHAESVPPYQLRDALAFGADPNEIYYKNASDSLLMESYKRYYEHRLECIQLLLEAGADPNYKNPTGQTTFDILMKWDTGKEKDVKFFLLFLNAGFDIYYVAPLPAFDMVLAYLQLERDEDLQKSVILKELEEKLLTLGADIEAARTLIKTEEDMVNARKLPISERPWLLPGLKKKEKG